MAGTWDVVLLIAGAVLLAPVIVNPSTWPIAAAIGLTVVLGGKLLKYLLGEMWDLEKQRRMGEKSGFSDDLMYGSESGDDDRGGR
ncbi:hypothetical protein C471_07671 [Halorubrum saccharovorum DSM 1137]|uniref:Uncharacterized protein n=1 Tax=Halorubrum saccharovorum DSM 1137 TaxID=1227484 RepID=M0E2T3_9EURY|nr:hypothetical protein [Halorubrum saccharovorum]ELZ40644.1 hypothetical protein C471_07671 [Halorubrum saccharovorum DSM 1137]